MTEILDKTREWSDRFGGVLRASAQTQYPYLYKGAVGGIEHVISVDNGAYYMEMWRGGENKDNYYATTGAAIKPLPGLAKGARLDEALDRFFTLMAKVEKQGWYEQSKLNPGRARPKATKKAIPKKIKRLLGLKKNGQRAESGKPGQGPKNPPHPSRVTVSGPRGMRTTGLRKRVMEKVDPEIGPSRSVGHRKPSNLSPETGVSKLAKMLIADIGRLNKTSAQNYIRYAPHGAAKPHTPPSASCPNCPKKPPVKKQMTEEERFRRGGAPSKPIQPMHPGQRMGGGPEVNPWANKPGGGTGKGSNWPPKKMRKNVVALTGNQPGSGRVKVTDPMKPAKTKPGTPAETYHSPQGFSGRRMGGPGSKSPAVAAPQRPNTRFGKARKIDDIEGGRVNPAGGTTPVKPGMGGPGQPSSYGSTGNPQYSYQRKGCPPCVAAEVAKAVKAVGQSKPPVTNPRTGKRATPKPGGGPYGKPASSRKDWPPKSAYRGF